MGGAQAPSGSSTKNWLTIFGLGVFWFSTYAIVCAKNGSVDALSKTQNSVPLRLVNMGGVYGVGASTMEVLWHTVCAALFGISALGVCDFFYARHTLARYFALHVITNFWISLLCIPDLHFMITDPIAALSRRETVNHWPTALVFSIHIYHMVFFRNLHWTDWLHHVLMVVIGAPLMITGEVGHLMNFNHFFMCGVPGGADYAMLFAVKHGWMSPLEEKRINAGINVWVRVPALIFVASFGFLQVHLQSRDHGLLGGTSLPAFGTGISIIRIFLALLASWNGLFFMERVVGNYHVCAYKARQESKALKARQAAAASSSPDKRTGDASFSYDSEEHFTSSLPIVGMRVSVSSKELAAIERSPNEVTAELVQARGEAYPASEGFRADAKKVR